MAQDLFETDEMRKSKKRDELIARGMLLWFQCAEEYRVLPYKYLFLMDEKKSLKIPVKKISHFRFEEYQDLQFFKILSEDEARAWLEDKTLSELTREVERIEKFINEDYIYRSIKCWVAEAIYTIAHSKRPNTYCLATGVSNNTISYSSRIFSY